MATRSSIRTSVLNLLSNHTFITATNINNLIIADHQQILNDHSWSKRKTETLIELVATYSTGTVSGSSGSTTLTGASTVWTSGMVDRYIRIGDDTYFYRITAVASATSLTLEASLPAAVSASTTYTIFQHIYDLPSTFGRVLSATTDTRLVEVTRPDLDRIDSYRSATATRPDRFCILGLDSPGSSAGVFQIEFYPVPSSATKVRVQYLRDNELDEDTDEPLYRSDVLVWKTAESGACFLYARTGDQAWAGLADRYRTRYNEALEGALRDDLARSSPPLHVRDAMRDYTRGDDFWLSHDSWGLR